MREIVDEIYMTVEDETDSEWIIRYSVVTQDKVGGFWKLQKVFNDNEKYLYEKGAAQYMFIFKDGEQIGTAMYRLEDDLFGEENDEKYESTINSMRNCILEETILDNAIKISQ